MIKKLREKLYRVDLQVSILTATLVFLTSLSAFGICYVITYNDSIESLKDRVEAIYTYVDISVSKDSFKSIDKKEDIESIEYINAKKTLESIKNATGVMYLYTAKENAQGELIYVIDGLDYSEDFRYPGDEIEEEIQADLRKALSGEMIMPNKIKSTDWGKIFITYLPVYDGEEVIGAVGIEFEAEHQFNTFRLLATLIPIMSLIFCVIAIVCAYFGFRRISNPLFKDMANMDRVTNLKNRNAFDVDLNNLQAKRSTDNICFIVMDLDKLKYVNDNLGHDMGDEYIKIAGKAIIENKPENIIGYRIGGDEFVLISINVDEKTVENCVEKIKKQVEQGKELIGSDTSISIGMAKFEPSEDEDFFCVYKRADKEMYKDKNSKQEKN